MMDRQYLRRMAAVAWLALFTVSISPALAQQAASPQAPSAPTLEELTSMEVSSVFTAARHEQRLGEAPAAVTVITAEDIAVFGWRTLTDVLNNVRGFYVTNDRNYSYLGVNGFGRPSDYNNRVLLLVDGHRANDDVYDGASIGTDLPIDLSLIERIEVIRGPGSALYGTSAFFAVVNLVTKSGGSFDAFEAGVEVASERLFRTRVTFGAAPTNDRQVLISATRHSSDGASSLYYPEFDDPSTGFGITSGTDADESTSLFGSATLGDFTVQALFGSRRKLVPTGSWGVSFADPRNRTKDSRGWINVAHHTRMGTTELTSRAAFDHMGYEGFYVYDEDLQRDFARGNWLTGEVTTDTVIAPRFRLGTGFEAKKHFDQDQWAFYDSDPAALVPASFEGSSQYAVYGQGEFTMTPKATITVGARADWWSRGPDSWKPRLGLVLHPVRDGSLKVLYGGAFRSPNMYELNYYADVQAQMPPLEPEEVSTTEVVYEQSINGRVRLVGSVFHTHINGLINEYGEGNEIYFANSGEVVSNGAAGDLELRWPNGVLLRGGYSFQRVRDELTGEPLSNAPRHLLSGNVAVPLLDRRLTAALTLNHVSARLSTNMATVDPSTVANVNLLYRPRGSRWSFAAGIDNLFDAAYAHPVGAEFVQEAIQQNGRTASVRAIVHF